MRTRLLIALVLVAGGLATPTATAQTKDCERSDLTLKLRLDQRTYERDEPVRMKMVVVNEGPPCTMVWGDGERATFYVFEDDKKIWDENACLAFTQAVIEEEWDRGHREVYRATWRHWKNERTARDCTRKGSRVGPGNYKAQGHFMGDGEPKTRKKPFRVEG